MSTKKQITIELDGKWVLQHRDDDELPIAVIKATLSSDKNLIIKDSSLTTITIVYDEQLVDYGGIKDCIMRLFAEHYPEDKVNDIVSFQSSDVVDEEQQEEDVDSQKQEDRRAYLERRRQELIERLQHEVDEDSADVSEKSKDGGAAIDKINALVGAAEFKALSNEILGIAEEITRTDTYEVFTNQCYLFSIGDGCGLTTYLELMAQLISECKLCSIASRPVREERIDAYREGIEPFEGAMNALNSGSEKNLKVLCVDISEWMDRTDNRYFKQFLRTVEKHANEYIVVFRIPFVDKDVLERIKYSLSDLLSVKTVTFPPLSQNEIKECAENELRRFGFSIAKPSWDYFFSRISEEKSDGKFYGVNTVKKVVRELIYQKHLVNVKKEKKSKQISVKDTKALCSGGGDLNLSGMEQLNKLVGIENVKKRVDEIIAQIELSIKDKAEQRPCIHMRFVGNPGTGKTTVARIIGKILKERGVLRVGAFYEYAGRDFCGRYVGETAPKTTSICRDAYGSVLFIDEAYSLYRGDADSRDYGREAIDTLIAEMENHRNDFVVIMAGYTDDMDKLVSGNLGLSSRMPYTIEFPNFTRDQLYDIFVSMVKEKFKYDKEIFDAARRFFDELPDDTISSKEFANARYVRNLFERTWAKAAMRCQLNGKTQVILTREDFEHASADKEFAANIPKKAKIGFNI
ncbi:MAG: AAA family ATPase [Clostridia bacterium]|nr:AAA family ATPase [Clostridia bacterium]